ncbi:hypothetical protein CCC_01752 [Paramagnetospirillum magnetotacticum MS-1]|uniref:Uncharacterized protein n=1 Tax=Paramagnetospirillum magnetotacticum MS-1 TaxID=272627 RepID=A0A0C2UGQ9_PARME|nr:hypothetical protein [Paramagnetospirillum magnetotacticum]KIM00758.1 hypothetical protein CCC_01752 [Paramagnetospirillum magnetotacticum MS-1]
MSTEIYSCREGQELKQGKLDYSDIDDRETAEIDAKRRCKLDPTIKKVAYYKVAADGEFRLFFSYTNPNCKPVPKAKPVSIASTARKAAPKKKPEPKPGLFARLKKSIGLS